MAIFPNLIFEETVQVGDRTRLDAVRSFVTQDESDISAIEIKPDTSEDYIDVTTDKYLDWEYDASGTKTVSVKVTAGNASASGVTTASITVVTAASDYLFSNDEEIKVHEPDIMKWVRDGRNSYKDVHRRAQTMIVKWLDKEGYTDTDNEPYTKAAIVDIEEVKQWAVYLVLRLIFDGISNATDDVFANKAKMYKGYEVEWRKRAVLRLDTDGDGVVSEGEEIGPAFGFVGRR